MATIIDIGRKYGKSAEQVRDALVAVKYGKKITVAAKIESSVEQQLDSYWRQQSAAAKNKQQATPDKRQRTRTIGQTQVSERPRRMIKRPVEVQKPPPVITSTAKTTTPPATATTAAVAKPPPVKEVPPPPPIKPQQPKEQKEQPPITPKAAEVKTQEAPPPKPQAEQAQQQPEQQPQQQQATAAEVKPAAKAGHSRRTIKMDKDALRKWAKERDRRKEKARKSAKPRSVSEHGFTKPADKVIRQIAISETITVSHLAAKLSLKTGALLGALRTQGVESAADDELDRDTAFIIVESLGHKPIDAPDDDLERDLAQEDAADKKPRPPVVTVMGHVDHGKTSLLDFIRKTKVADGEAGGITQHINAYQAQTAKGLITFIDTPGHALFTEIRSRGARVTDIVVLVVAADDGVRPQTIEAIHHAQAAGVPIVVAANKTDKPQANAKKLKKELIQHNVLTEELGGDVQMAQVSALTGKGIDELLDAIITQTAIMDISAAPNGPARGVVIESRLDKGRGVVVPLIITSGELHRGDIVVCGAESGRVRAMTDANGKTINKAGPSMPIEIQGLSGIPETGAELAVVDDERKARDIAQMRRDKSRQSRLAAISPDRESAEEQMMAFDKADEPRDLPLVVKADVNGSREALVQALSQITGKNLKMKVIHSGVGGVSESDVHLAQASGAVIVGFNVRADAKTRKLVEERAVKVVYGRVIYDLLEAVKELALTRLARRTEEEVIGAAEVRKVFDIGKLGNIAGCIITEGIARSDARARIMRDGAVVFEGGVSSLRHFKESVAEVRTGEECGIGIGKFSDIKTGDVIEMMRVVEIAAEL
ncbi:MAG: translation initiation factor IF-2 [Gammaproteobacteria bacterium]